MPVTHSESKSEQTLLENFTRFRNRVEHFLNSVPITLIDNKEIVDEHYRASASYMTIANEFRSWIAKLENNIASKNEPQELTVLINNFSKVSLSQYNDKLKEYETDTKYQFDPCITACSDLVKAITEKSSKAEIKQSENEYKLFKSSNVTASALFAEELRCLVGELIVYIEPKLYIPNKKDDIESMPFPMMRIIDQLCMRLGVLIPLNLKFNAEYLNHILFKVFLNDSFDPKEMINNYGYVRLAGKELSAMPKIDKEALSTAFNNAIDSEKPMATLENKKLR